MLKLQRSVFVGSENDTLSIFSKFWVKLYINLQNALEGGFLCVFSNEVIVFRARVR